MKFSHSFFERRRTNNYHGNAVKRAYFKLLDRIVFAVGVAGPVMTIPQLWIIFAERNAAGISVLSFTAWTLMDIPWIVYGFAHRERPIVWTYTLWFVCNALIVVGALLYG